MNFAEVDAYLSQIDKALAFDRRYARSIRQEVADHLQESVEACLAARHHHDDASHTVRANASNESVAAPLESRLTSDELAGLLNRFGQPRVIAAQLASVYVFKKMLTLMAWLLCAFAASCVLKLFIGPLSWLSLMLSALSALIALPTILRVRSASAAQATAYRSLCMPMMASTTSVLLLVTALVSSAVLAVTHCDPLCMTLRDIALAALLAARLVVHRRQTASMCALWRSVP